MPTKVHQALGDRPHMAALSDSEGIILRLLSDPPLRRSAEAPISSVPRITAIRSSPRATITTGDTGPDTHPEFGKPAASWNPVISPGNLMMYRGDLFSNWRGDALAAGLSSQAIVRVERDGVDAREVERYDFEREGRRIRPWSR